MVSAGSKYKHKINEIICQWSYKYKKRALRILETHQFIGNATIIYRKYGGVISYEINPTTYERVINRFPDAFNLERILQKGYDLLDFINSYRRESYYPVILPNKPSDSLIGIRKLNIYSFDIVDIDPPGSPHEYFPNIFNLLDDNSILFVTSGSMHYARFNPISAMEPYNIGSNKGLKLTRRLFQDDNILIIGFYIINEGLKYSILLFPIFIHDYWTRQKGVQRIGFYINKKNNVKNRNKLSECYTYDPILKVNILKCSSLKKGSLNLCRFDDTISINMLEDYLISRLNYLSSI